MSCLFFSALMSSFFLAFWLAVGFCAAVFFFVVVFFAAAEFLDPVFVLFPAVVLCAGFFAWAQRSPPSSMFAKQPTINVIMIMRNLLMHIS